MSSNVNPNSSLFNLAHVVNSGWFDSENQVPYHKSVKKFLELFGIARLQGKNDTDPISIREFVQIVERDGIDLGSHWRDSDDSFKAALKGLLEQIGKKRKAAETHKSSSSSSSSTDEPTAKRRKVVASTGEQEKWNDRQLAAILLSLGPKCPTSVGEIIKSYTGGVEGNDLLVETIRSALGREPIVPVDLCKLIQSFSGNHGETQIEQFIRGFQRSIRAAARKRVMSTQIPVNAFEQAEALLKKERIDRNVITTLDLSGFDWFVTPKSWSTKDNIEDGTYMELYEKMQDLCYTERGNVLLRLIQKVAPNVKHVNMRNWIPHYDESEGLTTGATRVIDGLIHSLSRFTELETLELSYHDLVKLEGGRFLTQLSAHLLRKATEREEAPFPKLKTIRIVGGTLPAEMQAKLKAERPKVVIECLPK